MTANAIYTNADQTIDLVVLDDTDCLLAVVEEGISEERAEAIYAGETEYQVSARNIEVGDGDIFDRLATR